MLVEYRLVSLEVCVDHPQLSPQRPSQEICISGHRFLLTNLNYLGVSVRCSDAPEAEDASYQRADDVLKVFEDVVG